MHQFLNRRRFLRTSSLVASAAVVPARSAWGFSTRYGAAGKAVTGGFDEHLPAPHDERACVDVALDAARRGGATYADVQFRIVHSEVWNRPFDPPNWTTVVGFGVRAYFQGCWGVANVGGMGSLDDAARLGADAARRARCLAERSLAGRGSDLAPLARVATGEWIMPIAVDPFTVSVQEKTAFLAEINESVAQLRGSGGLASGMSFRKERRLFASTDGARTLQTIYNTGMFAMVQSRADWVGEQRGVRTAPFVTMAGAGWEYVQRAPIRDRAEELLDLATRSRRRKAVDVGRYDIVFDAQATANLLDSTIGRATELDRALGYRANDEGTSYLNDPLGMLGKQRIGSSLMTVTSNRSQPGGAATVQWDDEGVVPVETTIVKDGVLAGFQTTRESAAWLAPVAKERGLVVESTGCAGTYSATEPVGEVSPNFTLVPGHEALSFDAMIKQTKRGLAVYGGYISAEDQQALNGAAVGNIVFEITNGALGRSLAGAEFVYRTPELWKNVRAFGGAQSAASFGRSRFHGAGAAATHTITAVPMIVADCPVTDQFRTA
jgi:TldD protein